MLYQWYETQRALLSPFCRIRQRVVQALQPPAVAVHAHAAGAARLGRAGPDAPAGQGIREARVQHQLGQRRRRRSGGAAAGRADKPFCRLLRFKRFTDNPAMLTRMKDAAHGAGGGAAVGPPFDAAARHRARAAARPQGLHHRLDRRAHGASRPRPVPSRRLRRTTCRSSSAMIGPDVHVISVCQPTVPVLAAVSLMASGGRSHAAHA